MSVAAISIGMQMKLFHLTKHPIIEGYDPPEGCGSYSVDEVYFDLADRPTQHLGPIAQYY
jgi:hypothetical protein